MSLVGYNMAVAGAPGEVHTSQKNDLLARSSNGAGKEYVYLKGVASTIAGSWVSFDEAGVTTLIDSDVAASLVGPVAVATAAVDATTEFGWYQIYGSASARVLTSFADNGKVFATSTAGDADDAAVTGNQIHGAIGRSAEASNLATVQLFYPFIGVTDAII